MKLLLYTLKLTEQSIVARCEALIICPQINRTIDDFDVLINHTTIRAHNDVKYVNVWLDSKFNFRKHLEFAENKLSRTVGILSTVKSVLPEDALFKLYYALSHPHQLHSLVA